MVWPCRLMVKSRGLMKFCTGCDCWKLMDEFHKQTSAKDGRQSMCIACKKLLRNKEADRKAFFWSRYRLRPADIAQMLELQANSCAICQSPFDGEYHIDHDHKTGKIRGILCRKCNIALGYYEYLKQHGKRVKQYLS